MAPADAEVAPAADKEALEAAVTPAAVDSTAASGEPIAEAMVALQEVMEPAPVPEPVLEGESSNPMPPACCFCLTLTPEPAHLHEVSLSDQGTQCPYRACCAVSSITGQQTPLSLLFGRMQLLTDTAMCR